MTLLNRKNDSNPNNIHAAFFTTRLNHELISLCLYENSLKQKDLATRLGVSSAVLSRWKSGETIPTDRLNQLLDILPGECEEDKITWIQAGNTIRNLVGNIENLKAWYQYLFSNSMETDDQPADIFTGLGADKEGQLVVNEFLDLCTRVGITPPPQPDERYLSSYDGENDVYDEDGSFLGKCEDLAFYTLTHNFIENYNALYNWFYPTFTDGFSFDTDSMYEEIGSHLSSLAFCNTLSQAQDQIELSNLGTDIKSIKKLEEKTYEYFKAKIHTYCRERLDNNLPIKFNYFALLNYVPSYLADAEKLGDDLLFDGSEEDKLILEYVSFGEKLIISKLEEMEEKISLLLEFKPSS